MKQKHGKIGQKAVKQSKKWAKSVKKRVKSVKNVLKVSIRLKRLGKGSKYGLKVMKNVAEMGKKSVQSKAKIGKIGSVVKMG